MGKLEDLIAKRNSELEQERIARITELERAEKARISELERAEKARIAEKDRIEREKEIALKEEQRREAITTSSSINFSESVALGLLYGLIGAVAGMVGIGLVLWIVLLIILGIFGSNMDSDSILNLSGAIGLIIGAIAGYLMGFSIKRQ